MTQRRCVHRHGSGRAATQLRPQQRGVGFVFQHYAPFKHMTVADNVAFGLTHATTVFVTHDQEEAMQIADHIVLVNRGRVEQIGTPRDLYERPANEFVLTFVGEATNFRGELVRPHDVVISTLPEDGAEEALVERVAHLGFEVRVQLVLGEGQRFEAQVTHDEAERLELAPGHIVYARLVRNARIVSRGHDRGQTLPCPSRQALEGECKACDASSLDLTTPQGRRKLHEGESCGDLARRSVRVGCGGSGAGRSASGSERL